MTTSSIAVPSVPIDASSQQPEAPRESLIRVFDRCVHRVYSRCYAHTGDHHEAAEATTVVFQQALDAWQASAPVPDVDAWLLRLTDQHLQRMPRSPAFLPPTTSTPVTAAEIAQPLWQAVDTLTPAYHRVLTLRYGQGLTNQQLARILNRSETATQALTVRALQALLQQAPQEHAPDAGPTAVGHPLSAGQFPLDPTPTPLDTLGATLRATAPAAPIDPLVFGTLRRLLKHKPRSKPTDESSLRNLAYSRYETPIGTLLVAYSDDTVLVTDLGVPDDLFERECSARLGCRPDFRREPPATLHRALLATIERGERFRGKVDLSRVPAFQRTVLLECLRIRSGEVRSYSWLARAVGSPGAARAVGTSMAHNPIPVLIPCHRVVRSDYHIGEYGCGGPTKKRAILAHEDVDVDRLEQLARQGIRFLGSATTKIFCLPGCYTGRRIKPQYERPFVSEREARTAGFRPCKVCRPA